MSKPKLLVLTSSFPRGPRDQSCDYIRQLATRLTEQFEVTVLTSASPGAMDREQCGGASVFRFHYLWPRRAEVLDSAADKWETLQQSLLARLTLIFYLPTFFWHAVRRAREADVILSHWLVPSGVIGACVASRLQKPHVLVEHSGALRFLRRLPWGSRLARFAVRRSNRVVTVSHELLERLAEMVPEARRKSSVIPMGVDTKRPNDPLGHQLNQHALGNLDGHKKVLYLGRLAEVKGVGYLIQALSGFDGAALIVAGDGEQKSELRLLAERGHVRAIFVGRLDEEKKWDVMKLCDAVVIPSVVLANGRTEGVPVVCLEAMAAGKPVIASNVGGIGEVIRHGENGLLVEPANVAELRNALVRVLGDDDLCARLGDRGKKTAQRYDWVVIVQSYNRVLASTLVE